MKIGVFGGSFDPPHMGHLVVAEQVLDQLGFDQVLFVVANHPWQKGAITPAEQRMQMTTLALGGSERMSASAVELQMGGPSYTYETLQHLSKPGVELFPIVGADAAAGLETWHNAAELAATYTFVVVNRPGETARPAGWNYVDVGIPPLDISSSQLRGMIDLGRSIRYLTPDPVIHLIKSWGLYRRAM